MPLYIMLITLTPEGRAAMAQDPERLMRAEHEVALPNTEVLGLYAVLGQYDFVGMLEAPDNEAAARFSLHLGVFASVQIETLPAIPISKLEYHERLDAFAEAGEREEPGGTTATR